MSYRKLLFCWTPKLNHPCRESAVFSLPLVEDLLFVGPFISYSIKKPLLVTQWLYADRTFLPLRRRAAKILRPLAVAIRERKPWTFFLLRLFGWKVRFNWYTSRIFIYIADKSNVLSRISHPLILSIQPVCQNHHDENKIHEVVVSYHPSIIDWVRHVFLFQFFSLNYSSAYL